MTAAAAIATQTPLALERHTVAQTILLLLLPGAVVGLVFALLARPAGRAGWPTTLALLLAWPTAGLPVELGFLLYLGWKRNGRLSLVGVLLNREPMPFRHYAWLVPGLLVGYVGVGRDGVGRDVSGRSPRGFCGRAATPRAWGAPTTALVGGGVRRHHGGDQGLQR